MIILSQATSHQAHPVVSLTKASQTKTSAQKASAIKTLATNNTQGRMLARNCLKISTINKVKSLISANKIILKCQCHMPKVHKYHPLPKVWIKAILVSLTRYQTMKVAPLLIILQWTLIMIKLCSSSQKKAVWTRSDIIKSGYKILQVNVWSGTNPRIRPTTRSTSQGWAKTATLLIRICTRFPTTATTASKPARWRNVAGLPPNKRPSDKDRSRRKNGDVTKSRHRPL